MCLIVVALGVAPRYPLVVAANRDELHARPARPAEWWSDAPHVIGGRDLLAGGTWLALDRGGRFAGVTNIRDANRPVGLRSRGSLVAGFLSGTVSAERYSANAVAGGAEFGAFNLLVYDGRELYSASNRAPAARLGPGVHAFSNAPPGVDWPKTSSALAGAERALTHAAPAEPLFALLAERGVPDSPGPHHERAHFVLGSTYGTRCSTVVLVDAAGRVTFAERSFNAEGSLTGEIHERFELER